MSLVNIKVSGNNIVCSVYSVTMNETIYYYMCQFYNQKLFYDILEPYRCEIANTAKLCVTVRQTTGKASAPMEFLILLAENEHVITEALQTAESMMGRRVWMSGDEKILNIKTKPKLETPQPPASIPPKESNLIYTDAGDVDVIHSALWAIEAEAPELLEIARESQNLSNSEPEKPVKPSRRSRKSSK